VTAASRLILYHTSDIHARRGFGSRLASLVEPDAVLVDSGDALAGSSVFYDAKEEVIAELAQAPYRAMAVGNREFHYLHGLFKARARRLRAPLVCSNLIDLRAREAPFRREIIVQASGTAVRLLALLVPQYRTGSGWERVFGWRFLAPDVALREMIGGDAGTQVPDSLPTIVLSHLGLPQDRELAARWPKLAAILGGHTHAALAQPEIINGVPIAHPGAYASHVGRLELEIVEGRARCVSYRLLPLLQPEADTAHEHLGAGRPA
jgi:2',3'-cyclic-nucleotide 2'-phosphodiesterase (5'-nucleotidase family)